ncbi:MAG TPA: DUF2267 domain-containing protein [Acidimicrobiales bacterium]|nr:DUF2267 domain-containing protein [Acidimicrobiales bacterium]
MSVPGGDTMRKILTRTAVAAAAVAVLRALLGPGTPGRARLRRAGDRAAREVRHQAGRWTGASYRLRGRRPDPDVPDTVLADRVRSTLGPLEKRLDLPHIHVMVEDHTALLHGDVASPWQADELEQAVLAVSGVVGVESHLHVGLLPSDTRPSAGSQHHAPSPALGRLLAAASGAGVPESQARHAVRAVLGTFVDRLPAGERDQVAAHLPDDVRRLVATPRRIGEPAAQVRTVADLVARVAAQPGLPGDAEQVTAAVLGTLRSLVPEEVADIAAVLPADLERFWQAAPTG